MTIKDLNQRQKVADARIRGTRLELIRRGFEVEDGPQPYCYIVKLAGKKLAVFWPFNGWFNLIGVQKDDPQERGFENLKKYLKGFKSAENQKREV